MTFYPILNLQNTDRARTIAVFVFLAELWLCYWFPIPHLTLFTSPPAAEADPPLLWIMSDLVYPNADAAAVLPATGSSGTSHEVTPEPTDNLAEQDSTKAADPGDVMFADDIRIVSFSPSVPPWVGDMARFTVNVEYSLATAPSGKVILSICSCKNTAYTPVPLKLSDPAEELATFSTVTDAPAKRGRNSIALTNTFRIPVADELLIVAKLEAGTNSSPADHRHVKLNDAGRPPQGERSSVNIRAIDPDPAMALSANENIEVWIAVDYNLLHEYGLLRLWIEDEKSTILSEYHEDIRSGQRRLAFTGKLQIPSPDVSST
ncbi:MAG TPA: hypothetical protein VFR18_11515, partial [Terriglobia bacterium]|nr:hypothetical protein [Terriglobia bacterium]